MLFDRRTPADLVSALTVDDGGAGPVALPRFGSCHLVWKDQRNVYYRTPWQKTEDPELTFCRTDVFAVAKFGVGVMTAQAGVRALQ